MKIIALGDTHGRTNWKKIIAKETFDKIIFIGDYFDTQEDISPEQQINNFKKIIRHKKKNMDKVVLLLGNHDYQYLKASEKYPSYQVSYGTAIQKLLHQAMEEDLLQICFVWKKLVFTHAGVTKTWCKNNHIRKTVLANAINDLFKSNPGTFGFTIGRNLDMNGDDICQTPIWVRPRSLIQDRLGGYKQIVGHTPVVKLSVIRNIALIDSLGTTGEYLVCLNGKLTAKTL